MTDKEEKSKHTNAMNISKDGTRKLSFERNQSVSGRGGWGNYLGCRVVIPVVTFLTPLAEHFSDLKDR